MTNLVFRASSCTLPACAILGAALAAVGAAQDRKVSVDGGRPLYEAVKQLHQLNGWLVSYQDPPYEHPDDLAKAAPSGAAAGAPNPRRHMSPLHRSIEITYPEPRTGTVEERRKIIDGIVERFSAAGAGHFRVQHNEDFSHIVPASVKRISGTVEKVTSLCDVSVSLPPKMRTMNESVTDIPSQVWRATNVPVVLGVFPGNLFLQRPYQAEAHNENACDVVDRVFESANAYRAEIGPADPPRLVGVV